MERTKRRSTALKMALAGMCTALCIEGMLQRGLYVPVLAEDTAADLALTIEWLTSTPEELELFAVTAFGSVESALQNPTFAAVWAGYKEAKWFLENPSLEAVSDVNDSITVQNLRPHLAYFYPESGIKTPVFWYDLSLLNGLGNARITGLPFLECSYYTASIILENNSGSSDAFPFISSFETDYSGNIFTGYRFYISRAFNQPYRFTMDTTSYIQGPGFQYYILNTDRFRVDSVSTTNGIPTVTPSSACISDNSTYWFFSFSGNSIELDLSSLPDIGIKQMFVPATATNWINEDFYPYVASQTEEGQPLEGFELTPPPGATPVLPDVGTLDSLNFPPGLPSVQYNDVALPSEPLPEKMLSGASFWFTSFTNMLDALGVKYIVITFLIIALIMAILKI